MSSENLVKLNTWSSSVLEGFGQSPSIAGSLLDFPWLPRNMGNQGSVANLQGFSNQTPTIDMGDINLTVPPGGEFSFDFPTATASNTVSATNPVVSTISGSGPLNYDISLSSTPGDYGSGAGSVGQAITTVIENTVGGVGVDLIRIDATTSQDIPMSENNQGNPDIRVYKYPCSQIRPSTVSPSGSPIPTYVVVSTGHFYDFFSLAGSTGLVDNEVTTGGVATLAIKYYEEKTIVLGRKFTAGGGYGNGNTWYGAALPNFNVTCT